MSTACSPNHGNGNGHSRTWRSSQPGNVRCLGSTQATRALARRPVTWRRPVGRNVASMESVCVFRGSWRTDLRFRHTATRRRAAITASRLPWHVIPASAVIPSAPRTGGDPNHPGDAPFPAFGPRRPRHGSDQAKPLKNRQKDPEIGRFFALFARFWPQNRPAKAP